MEQRQAAQLNRSADNNNKRRRILHQVNQTDEEEKIVMASLPQEIKALETGIIQAQFLHFGKTLRKPMIQLFDQRQYMRKLEAAIQTKQPLPSFLKRSARPKLDTAGLNETALTSMRTKFESLRIQTGQLESQISALKNLTGKALVSILSLAITSTSEQGTATVQKWMDTIEHQIMLKAQIDQVNREFEQQQREAIKALKAKSTPMENKAEETVEQKIDRLLTQKLKQLQFFRGSRSSTPAQRHSSPHQQRGASRTPSRGTRGRSRRGRTQKRWTERQQPQARSLSRNSARRAITPQQKSPQQQQRKRTPTPSRRGYNSRGRGRGRGRPRGKVYFY